MSNEYLETGNNGIELIKKFEGFKATAYLCPANIPTIGFGHTGKDISNSDVGVKTISEEEATKLLKQDLKTAEKAVKSLVLVDLKQHQFDALVSFVYNLGSGNFKSSTLLKLLNQGKFQEAASEFPKWVKANGRTLDGLVKRRLAEQKLFEGV